MAQLVFVYNADAGFLNALLDLTHKVLSPATYPCSLCALTHGARMRPEWKAFVQQLPLSSEFLHRDEFRALYPWAADTPLPAVLLQHSPGEVTTLISAAELGQTDLPGLMNLLQHRLTTVADRPEYPPAQHL